MKIPMNLKYNFDGKGMKEAFVALAKLPMEEFECEGKEKKLRRYLDFDKISEFLSINKNIKIELEWNEFNERIEGIVIGK